MKSTHSAPASALQRGAVFLGMALLIGALLGISLTVVTMAPQLASGTFPLALTLALLSALLMGLAGRWLDFATVFFLPMWLGWKLWSDPAEFAAWNLPTTELMFSVLLPIVLAAALGHWFGGRWQPLGRRKSAWL